MDTVRLCFCKVTSSKLLLIVKVSVFFEYFKAVIAIMLAVYKGLESSFSLFFFHFLLCKIYTVFIIFIPLCYNAIAYIASTEEEGSNSIRIGSYYKAKKITFIMWFSEVIAITIWLSIFNMPIKDSIAISLFNFFGIIIEFVFLKAVSLFYFKSINPQSSNEPNTGACVVVTQSDIHHESQQSNHFQASEIIEKLGIEDGITPTYPQEAKPSKLYDFTVIKFASIKNSVTQESEEPESDKK
ncbi:hypothetical protein SteCoe_24202 [Stentor coeruleus]|uniref:Uncharacterized protein n=1 Tax=Stentor coeruleus TaxID=5963 RepID=A0A1R2BI34_9CILI|nr:hypothetical protein SteCoe_24202 [Stentor coeruleus]